MKISHRNLHLRFVQLRRSKICQNHCYCSPVQVHSLVSHQYHSIHQDWGLWNSERMHENNIFVRRIHKHFEFLLRRHHIHDSGPQKTLADIWSMHSQDTHCVLWQIESALCYIWTYIRDQRKSRHKSKSWALLHELMFPYRAFHHIGMQVIRYTLLPLVSLSCPSGLLFHSSSFLLIAINSPGETNEGKGIEGIGIVCPALACSVNDLISFSAMCTLESPEA